jgi:hypothetical protein
MNDRMKECVNERMTVVCMFYYLNGNKHIREKKTSFFFRSRTGEAGMEREENLVPEWARQQDTRSAFPGIEGCMGALQPGVV